MKNILSKKHFPQGHFSQASAQFKLTQWQDCMNLPKKAHINKNATSAELGYIREGRSKIRISQMKYQSSLSAMMPKQEEQYKQCTMQARSKRRQSPSKFKQNFLTHSVDFVRSEYVERDSSFLNLQKKTSQSGFYCRPQVSISSIRIKENNASIRVIANKENEIQQLISKQISRNPITGCGIQNHKGSGIFCRKQVTVMDEILFQVFVYFDQRIETIRDIKNGTCDLTFKYFVIIIMQNFLFGKTTQPSFSPFGNTQTTKPGIITKIKNKITDLFQPPVNRSSVVQRIQQDLIQEEELNLQFENNFILCINPSKEDNKAEKRKILYPFDKYLQDENQKEHKVSKESQTDISFERDQIQAQGRGSKRFLKFKKNHAKIEKGRKMEENPRQLQFEIKFTQQQINEEENSVQKKIKSEITNNQIENVESSFLQNIQQVDFFDSNSLTSLKRQIKSDRSQKEKEIQKSIQKSQNYNIKLDTSASNTKEEEQNSLISIVHMDQSIVQDSLQATDETSSNSVEISNPLFCFFNSAKETARISSEQKQIHSQRKDNQQQQLSSRKQQDSNGNQLLSSVKKQVKLSTPEKNMKLSSVKKQTSQLFNECEQQEIKLDEIKEIIIEQPVKVYEDNQEQPSQKEAINDSNMMNPNNNLSLDSISQNFIQESSTNQQFTQLDKQIQKQDQQQRKENNPFLQSSTLISQDQINQYFQTGQYNSQAQPQQTYPVDLFKINNNTSLFNFNQPILPQQNLFKPLQDNTKIIQYSTNKQMEIIEQDTQQKQLVNLFQPSQQITPPWMNQTVTLQHQSLFQQAQQQTQYPISSLTLFSSNPYLTGYPQKQDVLSLFKDPQKQDRGKQQFQVIDLFSTEAIPQQNHLNNSFNKGNRKKQRINNI